ncbi:hypothetical protein ACXR8U_32310 (plasmid) [Methylobacterium radiotolerans]|jgi:hypothetical protein|uniref:hypothetical protein n=1 Tax=Methylobacterium TaxID=407 RepID=UPI0005E42D14|nr:MULTISPECIES: hypothetical protein [Methylobacterium]MBN6819805.1 hypothetical protein [Methylobacterium organophilum]OXE43472.1 hypothetical protein CCS92_02875 [Methylobacterium radiotolerans]GAN48718.1 hypothetical protein ME121_2736 [Methylobacterium sp. ME121]
MMDALARGWLVAWLVWSAVPVGSLVLMLIHGVTGGRWGEALAPALRPAAALVPLAGLAFLGVALGLPALYPWAAEAGRVKPDVARLYLDPALFDLRAALALAGWSALALLYLAGRCGPLVAALGLSFYGLTISLVAVDWILSVEPHFTSSAFAAGIALHQILAALAWAAVASPPGLDEARAADLAGLILASLLGVLYLGLMSYIVAWYGDLPAKAAWYLKRGTGAWVAVLAAAVALGGILPFAALLFARLRRSAAALRVVGLLVLVGIALHLAWYVLPAYGAEAGLAALFAVPGLALLASASRPVGRRVARIRAAGRPRHV